MIEQVHQPEHKEDEIVRRTQTIRETTPDDLENFEKYDESFTHKRADLRKYGWKSIEDARKAREENYLNFSDDEKEIISNAFNSALETNNSRLVPVLFDMGRETDLSLLDEIPEDQRTNLEAAIRFCRANELSAKANQIRRDIVKSGDWDNDQKYSEMLTICRDLVDELEILKNFELIATHSTSDEKKREILKDGQLVGIYDQHHYMNKDAVYAGVFGAYVDWNGLDDTGKSKAIAENTFRFRIPMSECEISINNPQRPRPMIAIPYAISSQPDSISTIEEQTVDTIPTAKTLGPPVFEGDSEDLQPKNLELFNKLVKDLNLDIPVITTADKQIKYGNGEILNEKNLVIETNEPPLIWITIATISGVQRITVLEDVDDNFKDIAA